MKVIYVVDSITDITHKIDKIKNRFGQNILFVVKAPLVDIFKTYGYSANAIYNNNLATTIHEMLIKTQVEDLILCYSSLSINDGLLNKFLKSTGHDKIVNVYPHYNWIEKFGFGAYNLYVQALFKAKDNLATPKLQYLPSGFVTELLATHFGNRMFELSPVNTINIEIENKEVDSSAKVKVPFNKKNLFYLIALLVITLTWITTFAFIKANYALIFMFVLMYLLDIVLFIVHTCKNRFDARFLR